MTNQNKSFVEESEEMFKEKFGNFYVSIDSKTKAIRIVDIENGVKVNGTDGSLIECVASGEIKSFMSSRLRQLIEEVRKGVKSIPTFDNGMVHRDSVLELLDEMKK